MPLVHKNQGQSLPDAIHPSHPADTSTWGDPLANLPNGNRELAEVEMRDEDDDDNLYADAREQVPLNEDGCSGMDINVNFTGWGGEQDSSPQPEVGLMVNTIVHEGGAT